MSLGTRERERGEGGGEGRGTVQALLFVVYSIKRGECHQLSLVTDE
jgi:hypothetical protein